MPGVKKTRLDYPFTRRRQDGGDPGDLSEDNLQPEDILSDPSDDDLEKPDPQENKFLRALGYRTLGAIRPSHTFPVAHSYDPDPDRVLKERIARKRRFANWRQRSVDVNSPLFNTEEPMTKDAVDLVYSKSYTPRRGAIDVNLDPKDVQILRDQVLLLREMPPQKTEGGIIIPDTIIAPQFTGHVVACGPDCTEASIIPGVRVMFGKYSGAELKINGHLYCLVAEHDILAVISEATEAERVD